MHAPVLKSSLMAVALAAACGGDSPPTPLAEKTPQIEVAKKKTAHAITLVVDATSAEVGFTMEAPFEKQEGEVPASAVSGEISLDLADVRKTTGLVNVDIDDLVIYQQVAEEEGQYAERTKSDLQNEHMKDWLEIGDDAPPEEADKNKLVQFSLTRIESPSVANLDPHSGGTQELTFVAVGDLRVHQRVATKKVPMKAKFQFEAGRVVSVAIETVERVKVDLAEHDVHPRTGFGKLAEKTLAAMAPKVGKEAAVSVRLTAKPQPQT